MPFALTMAKLRRRLSSEDRTDMLRPTGASLGGATGGISPVTFDPPLSSRILAMTCNLRSATAASLLLAALWLCPWSSSGASDHAGHGQPAAEDEVHTAQAQAALEEDAPPSPKGCCHPAKADEAPLPEGLTGLADAPPAAPLPPTVAVTLAAAGLRDQTGTSVQFPGEVLGDRLVVMDFIFTSCTTICPVLSAKLAKVQERLGARAGPEVVLVSVSLDPLRDTPARLAEFGARFKAGPAWRWLTGAPEDVTKVLKGLGVWTPRFADHGPVVLVGDPGTGRWHRFNGFPDVERLVSAVDSLAAARAAGPAAGAASPATSAGR